MTGIGRVLVVSPYRQLNPLVSFHFQDYFGAEKVFGLNNMEGSSARHLASEVYMKRLCLFGEGISYAKIASQMAKGAILKSTTLRESFTLVDFMRRYGESVLPLVYLQDEKLRIVTAGSDIPATGIELISLIPVESQQYAKEQQEKEALEKALAEKEDAERAALEKLAREQEDAAREAASEANAGFEEETVGSPALKEGGGEGNQPLKA